MAVAMTRFICPDCLSDLYIIRALILRTPSPPSCPRTSISAPNIELLLVAAFIDFLILT
ncbi:hypothetical protein T01_12598 [Trichinella spiralis]|uniref:Uncharacterized protein n=1 Tax=Trichinella spiralis TaxID=6334 RepID=A0A0V1APT0_TRISP|nr:hypothetical protein T01_12598 [Trichinella spiralis]